MRDRGCAVGTIGLTVLVSLGVFGFVIAKAVKTFKSEHKKEPITNMSQRKAVVSNIMQFNTVSMNQHTK